MPVTGKTVGVKMGGSGAGRGGGVEAVLVAAGVSVRES